MTKEELQTLENIAYDDQPFTARPRLREYLKTVKIEEPQKNVSTGTTAPNKPLRTGDQNAALHLWFRQIADTCRDAGIDAQLLFSKTVDLEVTEDTIKSLWHAVQKAYYKTSSTTELTKTEQIGKIADTLVRFFGERHELELPPFPNDPTKGNVRLTAMENMKKEDYPEHSKTAFE